MMSWWSEGGRRWWYAGGSWAGIEKGTEALSNVRVQGQDCGVSTCSPQGPTAQAIINPSAETVIIHSYPYTQVPTAQSAERLQLSFILLLINCYSSSF